MISFKNIFKTPDQRPEKSQQTYFNSCIENARNIFQYFFTYPRNMYTSKVTAKTPTAKNI